jgi:hypothetical protein
LLTASASAIELASAASEEPGATGSSEGTDAHVDMRATSLGARGESEGELANLELSVVSRSSR